VSVIALRRPDTCSGCGRDLPPGIRAHWDAGTRTVRCLACGAASAVVDAPPTAGGSAQREFERRTESRQRRVRARFPRIGGLLLALFDDPTSTKVWAQGAAGERTVGAKLDGLQSRGVHVLHDRRMVTSTGRTSRANIDHIVVSATGVWVVDAKTHRGTLRVRRSGGLFSPRVEELYIGGRRHTGLVDGLERQLDSVRTVLEESGVPVPVRGALCFVGTDLPWLDETIRGIPLVGPRGLAGLVTAAGSLTPEQRTALVERLERRFLPA
jgi:hypothetical protein